MAKTIMRGEVVGGWFRFSDYHIQDGFILPTKDARLEKYDPWSDFQDSQNVQRGRPYQDLLELSRVVSYGVESKPVNPEEDPVGASVGLLTFNFKLTGEEEILAFCRRYGPLGLLSQRYRLLSLPAQVDAWIRGEPGHWDHVVVTQRRHVFGPGGWVTAISTARSATEREVPGVVCKLLEEGHLRPQGEGELPGGVTHYSGKVPHGRLKTIPLRFEDDSLLVHTVEEWGALRRDGTWESPVQVVRDHFPSLFGQTTDSIVLPCPGSRSFWGIYGERVEDFVRSVTLFGQCLSALGNDTPVAAPCGLPGLVPTAGQGYLDELTSSIGPVLGKGVAGRYRQLWLSPSLVATIALMLLHDLTEDRQAHTCEVCEKLFVSRSSKARYCSKTCQNTAQKRAQRRNKIRRLAEESARVEE